MKALAEIINLKAVRKAKARAEKERAAEANRAKHGRTKDERTRTEAELNRRDHDLDNAKIEDDE